MKMKNNDEDILKCSPPETVNRRDYCDKKHVKTPRLEVKKRIMVVDDEETVGIGMTEILMDAGFEAEYVTSGKAALEAMSERPYHLIFMDMVMPGLNGLDTFRLLKREGMAPKVILFTGFFKEADEVISEGVKEGMVDLFIRKPFFAEEIIVAAKKYL